MKHVFRLLMRPSVFSLLLIAAAATAGAAQTPTPSAEQPPTQQATRRLTPEQRQIAARLRNSGLTREQVRQRLRQAGYDPNLADQYFEEIQRADSTVAGTTGGSRYTRPIPPPSGSLISGLRRIGVLTPEDSFPPAPRMVPDTLRRNVPRQRVVPKEPQVFGRELFAASTQFEPLVSGPVDPSYRLGPGDELTLIVTGDAELAYDLEVTPDGYIVVPNVGQVIVNGLTMSEAKQRLNDRLARVYSGILAGSVQTDVTVGKVRSKLVYVIGEVEVPGAYSVSGTATVFSALYRAGGPALNGSFRNIEVRRGNTLIRRVDIYDYLLRGDKGSDVTLEQGDVVFVPVVGTQVTIDGSVRRPAIFELKENEKLTDVLRFAGGTEADAALERIQIDRILPVAQRRPGHERVLVDIELAQLVNGAPVQMQDGDRIKVSKISQTRRNRVAVRGDVQRPGEYAYQPRMTALELIRHAEGLLPSAYTPNAHVVRLNLADSSTSIVRVVLDDPAAPDYAGKVVLDDLDELIIFGRTQLANPRKVEIFGHVKREGTYNFSEGMTVEDVVLLAGGFQQGADEGMVEVARRNRAGPLLDSLATVYNVPLQMQLYGAGASKGAGASSFRLEDGDQVFVRREPGYKPLSTVEVLGEVMYPGSYTVTARQERLTDVLKRAGGLTKEAYPRGLRLFRDGKPVGVDFAKAMKRPHSEHDIALEPGDRIEIPLIDPTVLVTGEVAFESRVRFEPGLSLSDYVARAGGVTEDGNLDRASIRYPNGELRIASRRLGIRTSPRVEPGSTITVPLQRESKKFDWDAVVGRTLTVLSTLATVVLTVRAIN
jgi:polysaccharide biosynthesis/export protein